MIIKLEINGAVFHCNSPQEAVQVATLMSGKNGVNGKNTANAATMGTETERTWFIDLIKGLPNSATSEDLVSALKVESTNGLGPKLRGLSKRFEEIFNMPLDTVLVRDARPGKPVSWIVNHSAVKTLE